METLFLDVHFYFVCFDKAQSLVHFLAVESCGPKPKEIWAGSKADFRPYNDARNHIEHVESRIKRENHRDLGNMVGSTDTFSGEKFDIGAAGLKRLTAVYEKVVEALKGQTPSLGPSEQRKHVLVAARGRGRLFFLFLAKVREQG